MSGLWRYLFRENPMNIETTRALRRFTASAGYTPRAQRNLTRALFGILYVLYAWFMVTIISYKEDMSQGILWFEFALLTLFIPGSLYAAISGERERQTWDSLILTNLSPGRILTGKLLWRLTLAGIILLIFMPPLILTHFVTRYTSSYSLAELAWLQITLAAWSIFLATFTVYVSSKTKRSVVTLSVVTVFLLSLLCLVPGLMSVFNGVTELPSAFYFDDRYATPEQSREDRERYDYSQARNAMYAIAPAAYLGSLLVHLNPAYMIHATENATFSGIPVDYWRDFLLTNVWSEDGKLVKGFGVFLLMPFIYLGGATLCIMGTMQALARLGMPAKIRKGQG